MITRKIKIGEFFYYFSRSIQNTAHHSQSLFDGDTSEGGGVVCMSVIRTQPKNLDEVDMNNEDMGLQLIMIDLKSRPNEKL